VNDTDAVATDSPDPVPPVLAWYAEHARALPWRSADRTPWGVLVSEVMLQQTQVARVEPIWMQWMQRWPTPTSMADGPAGDVVHAWGSLGYPRRALRLHSAAVAIRDEHAGVVPADVESLRRLPGIGEYTAAAVAAFAFGGQVAVLDTNVRRVLARWSSGRAEAGGSSITAVERLLAQSLLPEPALAPLWSVAVMELGALVCSARSPRCPACPLQHSCRWFADGRPGIGQTARRAPAAYAGSDRQARGLVLRMVRAGGPVAQADAVAAWAQARGDAPGARDQARRAIGTLAADGLVVLREERLVLPG
jgi:A/G-specific adenine glycosylase